MTVDEFVKKWLGRKADWDGRYQGQCVDLFRFYHHEVIKAEQPEPVRGAAWFWDNYLTDINLRDNYDRIINESTAVPEKGDVVVWNTNVGDGFGHIAIFLSGTANRFTSLDQNWPRLSEVTKTKHSYKHVLGWLRPKKEVMADKKYTEEEMSKMREERDRNWDLFQHQKKETERCQEALDAVEEELATMENKKKAFKGEVTKKETELQNLRAKNNELRVELKELRQHAKKSPTKEGGKESVRQLVSLIIGGLVAYSYTQFPVLGEIGIEQQALITALVAIIVRSLDKYAYQDSKNKKSGEVLAGIDKALDDVSTMTGLKLAGKWLNTKLKS